MPRVAKVVLLLAAVSANFVILWWRYHWEDAEIPGLAAQNVALSDAQAEIVLKWRTAAPVSLNSTAIRQFVANMDWTNCAPLPRNAIAARPHEISSLEKKSLLDALSELISTYSSDNPEALFDYMTLRGLGISPENAAIFRRLLTEEGSMSTASVEHLTERELFLLVADNIDYCAHWESLVQDSGCISLWRTRVSSADVVSRVPLGGHVAGLFKNQTRFHQLFEVIDHKLDEGAFSHSVFADIQFVVNHDSGLRFEPSPYHVRFVLNRSNSQWVPLELIHVGTTSGTSPPLLF